MLALVVVAVAVVMSTVAAQNDGPAPMTFLGEPDAPRITALRTEKVASVQKGKGGRSLAFKITLADGTQGYFKPEQTFAGAHWFAEIAAYHLDRALEIGRVPPTTGRVLPWASLAEAADGDSRTKEIVVDKDGMVRGAFIWWIPERLKRLRLGRGWEAFVRVEPPAAITPFQRPADYRAALRGDPGVREAEDPRRYPARKRTRHRAREISDMIVFDYLTQNVDRWGGDFTNIRTRQVDGPLIYLDNGAGFWWGEQRFASDGKAPARSSKTVATVGRGARRARRHSVGAANQRRPRRTGAHRKADRWPRGAPHSGTRPRYKAASNAR